MSGEIEAKLEVLQRMNTALGKITNVQIRLTLAGEDQLAKKMDDRRKTLLEQIEILQGKIAEEWTVNAATLSEKLREANLDVQSKTRSIKKKIAVANNAIKIIGKIDDALIFLKKVVPLPV